SLPTIIPDTVTPRLILSGVYFFCTIFQGNCLMRFCGRELANTNWPLRESQNTKVLGL
ncbi:hypothetical protein A2U01_0010066, partial [Trifolium medium]|nr:hypothetical protein [Trifolium medium]